MAKKPKIIKIDIGCGGNKVGPEWIGLDKYPMKGVDRVIDLGSERWPFKDDSVDEAHSSHFLEHLTNFNDKWERVHFFNELYRVMKQGAKAQLIFPHWCSNRYYGDPTHKEPFGEMGFFYLKKEWREAQAPHTDIKWNKNGYSCDFEVSWGNTIHPELVSRSEEFKQMATTFYKEALQDIYATLIKI